MPAQNPPVQQAMSTGNVAIKTEDVSLQQQLQSIDWDSERQLISSLSKLQELESKIHELRSLLPDRLLAPISPIVNPRRTASSNSIPRNPHVLNSLLRKSATEGVAEINNFKDLWVSPDMQAIWTRVGQKLNENKGSFPQPSGTWSQDYDLLLKQMDEEEQEKNSAGKAQAQPESERAQEQLVPTAAASIPPIYGTADLEGEGDLKSVVVSFQKRQIPGFQIASTRNESMIVVGLGLAGILFEIQEVLTTNNTAAASDTNTATPTPGTGSKQALPEWRVSTRQSHGKTGPSRLETAIVQQLNSRARKWDLRYLLELILAYSNVHSQPCKKCNRLTDSTAQLPIIRKPSSSSSSSSSSSHTTTTTTANTDTDKQMSNTTESTGNEVETILWDAYHPECV